MKTLLTASGPERHTVRVDGDEGSLVVDAYLQTIRLFSELPRYQVTGSLSAQEIRVPPGDPFEREVRHFLECIETQAEPITSGRLQRRNLELVLAAYASMSSGSVVSVAPL